VPRNPSPPLRLPHAAAPGRQRCVLARGIRVERCVHPGRDRRRSSRRIRRALLVDLASQERSKAEAPIPSLLSPEERHGRPVSLARTAPGISPATPAVSSSSSGSGWIERPSTRRSLVPRWMCRLTSSPARRSRPLDTTHCDSSRGSAPISTHHRHRTAGARHARPHASSPQNLSRRLSRVVLPRSTYDPGMCLGPTSVINEAGQLRELCSKWSSAERPG
jgi:hypothetical protein